MAPETPLTVVEEEWFKTTTGKISDSIKVQLLSDGSLRYRCAHRNGAGCTATNTSPMGMAAHLKAHNMPALINAATRAATKPTPRASASPREQKPKDPVKVAQAAERMAKARVAADTQIRNALTTAKDTNRIIRVYAILPHGLGAGAVTETVWLVAYPTGKVEWECTNAGCGYVSDGFGAVFAHRSQAHPRTAEPRTDRAAAARAVTEETPAAVVPVPVGTGRNGNGSQTPAPALPGTAVGDALVRSLLEQEAKASIAIDRDPRSETVTIEGPVEDIPAGEPEPKRTSEREPGVMPALGTPLPVTEPFASNGRSSSPLGSNGSPFEDTVRYVRERLSEMVDHLRATAAGEYAHLALAEEQRQKIGNLESRVTSLSLHRDTLLEEVEKLRAERPELEKAREELAQLRKVLRSVTGS